MPEPVEIAEFIFTPLEAFAAVDEAGAEPLARAVVGGDVIPAGGIVLVYGSGGAGKTTLVIDLCFALATGQTWLGIIEPVRKLRVSIIENEGPRAMMRKKLLRKLEASGATLDGGITILEEPWSRFTFADESQRRALALALTENETDVLVVGPLSRVGMKGPGSLDDIGEFLQLVGALRDLVERPFAVLLIHHENRAGQTSGAWENDPETVVHVRGQGHGRTRVLFQKCRWAGPLHGTAHTLVWADGETYTVEQKPEITDDTIADDLLAAVTENPGGSWSKLREHVTGNATQAAKVRDRLIAAGTLVNSATRDGYFNLWHFDDPASTRSDLRTGLERLPFPPAADEADPSRSPFPPIGNGGTERAAEPQTDATPTETAR